MYDMLQAEFDRLAGKTYLVKKTAKNSHFWAKNIIINSLWEDVEAKLSTPGQLLGFP